MAQTRMTAAERAKARTVKNLVWGLLACLGVVALFSLVVNRSPQEQVRAIDYSAELTEARKSAPFTVLAPEPLPAGWAATSARVGAEPGKPFTWHLGVLTPERKYVGLEQSNATADAFVTDKLGDTVEDGTSTVAGAQWQRLETGNQERALVRTAGGATTIVTGDVDYPTLETYAATLR
jgi:uncharacterized protein DUF4245